MQTMNALREPAVTRLEVFMRGRRPNADSLAIRDFVLNEFERVYRSKSRNAIISPYRLCNKRKEFLSDPDDPDDRTSSLEKKQRVDSFVDARVSKVGVAVALQSDVECKDTIARRQVAQVFQTSSAQPSAPLFRGSVRVPYSYANASETAAQCDMRIDVADVATGVALARVETGSMVGVRSTGSDNVVMSERAYLSALGSTVELAYSDDTVTAMDIMTDGHSDSASPVAIKHLNVEVVPSIEDGTLGTAIPCLHARQGSDGGGHDMGLLDLVELPDINPTTLTLDYVFTDAY
jgi:hypothetical protein